MLKKLQKIPEDQTLVAHAGVQFLDYGFRLPEEFPLVRSFVEQRQTIDGGDEVYLFKQIETNKAGQGFIDVETQELVSEKSTYSVQFRKTLEAFDSVWLPAPFLKSKGLDASNRESFEQGPTNWSRLRISKVHAADQDTEEYTHRLTLVFDTRPGEMQKGWPYVCPVLEDVRNETRFLLATELRDISWFLKEPWVTGWLKEELKLAADKLKPIRRADGLNAECIYWAYFTTLLQGLRVLLDGKSSSAVLPKVRFINTFTAGSVRPPVDVDLILDIGNSRTCGILIETGNVETLDIKNASILELRDLSQPEFSYQEPFRSHVEFAPAEFGSVFWSKNGGGRFNFKWPSLVRVGPEALRLYDKSSGAEGDTGISGPKRYIWDERENRQPWRFNVSESRHREQSAVFGDLMLLLTQDGERLKTAGPAARAALDPKFSRASLFTLMVMEVVLQAIVQINSADYRATKQHPNVHRVLRRILFTIPTATPLIEMRKYRARCEAAISLLWDAYGWDDPKLVGAANIPMVNIAYDEATCTQIVYLYNEIVQKLQRTPSDFFKLLNQISSRESDRLRIASLDIGGGTTDLMIISYLIDRPGNALHPTQNFREGFRKAGDDILEAVISQHVLKAIEAALAAHGVSNPAQYLRDFMSDTGKHALQRHLRKLFVSRVLVPIALHLLSQYETADMFGEARDPVAFSSIFKDNIETLQRVVQFFEEPIQKSGPSEFSLMKVEISLDFEGLGATIASVMGDLISLMCEVINRFDCDVLLLTGRPSRFPIMRDLILRYLPIAPHRIIFMHEYKVGNWYPFAGRLGKIDDPKTTVVVGALICALAENLEIRDFPLRGGGFSIKSTAKYIGRLLGDDTIRKEDVIFSQGAKNVSTESKTLIVDSPMFIGFRQLDLNRWPGTPLFFLDIAEDGTDAARHTLTMPWSVTLRRNEPTLDDGASNEDADLESFWVDQIIDRNGNDLPPSLVRLRLQTMRNLEGYWLDTGTVTID
jgi:hypothetical protein